MHTRESVAEPTQFENTAEPVFEWAENEVEESLQRLYRVDVAEREQIISVIRDMNHSGMIWKLLSRYDDAKKVAVDRDRDSLILAVLARIYIAGTLRKTPLIVI